MGHGTKSWTDMSEDKTKQFDGSTWNGRTVDKMLHRFVLYFSCNMVPLDLKTVAGFWVAPYGISRFPPFLSAPWKQTKHSKPHSHAEWRKLDITQTLKTQVGKKTHLLLTFFLCAFHPSSCPVLRILHLLPRHLSRRAHWRTSFLHIH